MFAPLRFRSFFHEIYARDSESVITVHISITVLKCWGKESNPDDITHVAEC